MPCVCHIAMGLGFQLGQGWCHFARTQANYCNQSTKTKLYWSDCILQFPNLKVVFSQIYLKTWTSSKAATCQSGPWTSTLRRWSCQTRILITTIPSRDRGSNEERNRAVRAHSPRNIWTSWNSSSSCCCWPFGLWRSSWYLWIYEGEMSDKACVDDFGEQWDSFSVKYNTIK